MKKNKLNTTTIAISGLLTAISIILSRFCVIYLTQSLRISFGNVPIIMAGMMFGPVVGGLVGLVADVTGSLFLSAYGWYPPLTLTSVMMGVIPGLIAYFVLEKQSVFRITLCIAPATFAGSILWSTFCLHKLYGSPFLTLLPGRVVVSVLTLIIESMLVFALFKAGINRFSKFPRRKK